MICTEYDQFLKDKDETVWMVEIYDEYEGDGWTIYQDDNRPGDKEPNAWKALKDFMNEDRGIVRFGLGFRDHLEWLPINGAEGIYFSKGAIADMLNPHTCNCYVLGWIKDGVLTKVWYRIPEVIEYQREVLTEFDKNSPSIIWCK